MQSVRGKAGRLQARTVLLCRFASFGVSCPIPCANTDSLLAVSYPPPVPLLLASFRLSPPLAQSRGSSTNMEQDAVLEMIANAQAAAGGADAFAVTAEPRNAASFGQLVRALGRACGRFVREVATHGRNG